MNVVKKMLSKMRGTLKDEKGATMVEYVLMVMAIALVAIATVWTIGTQLNANYDSIRTAVER